MSGGSGFVPTALTALMIVFLVVSSFQAILIMFSIPELLSHWQLGDDDYFQSLLGSEALPPISVVATIHDAERDAPGTARMLLDLEYPRHEVVLVNDGSSDRTLAALVDAYALYEVPPAFTVNLRTQPVKAYYRSRTEPRLLLIDKEAGGRGDAMNAGMNAARYPHTLAVGSNIFFEKDALLRLSRPFLLERDVAAVGGTLRIANRASVSHGRLAPGRVRGYLLGCQTVEFLRQFLFSRLGWNRVASNLIYPNLTAVFKREHVFGVGGFLTDDANPAIDFTIRLHRHLADTGLNPRMPVIPDPVAWTVIPERLADVTRARRRWQISLWRALRGNLGMFFNPEYGSFGLIAVPYFWIALIAVPFVEVAGYILLAIGMATGSVSGQLALVYLLASVGYGMLLSLWSVILQALTFQRTDSRREIAWLTLFAVVESLGYRQIMAWNRVTTYFTERSTGRKNG